jgi:PAS domain S-box-containing protein
MTRILIVDDIASNIYVLEAMLKGYGFVVTPARNGAEALDMAKKNPPDLIITDILMPVMDGFELCRQWKADERLNPVPFIFYTATYTDPRDEQFARNLGAERFLVKPQKPEILAQIVSEVLEESKAGTSTSTVKSTGNESEVLRQYNEVLFRKLEKKVLQLEADIAERMRVEEALSENEKFLDRIVENIPDMLFVKDASDLRFVRINKAGEELLGYPREEMYGKNDSDFFPEDQAGFFMEMDRKVIGEGKILNIPRETIRTKSRGERILHTKKIPIYDREGNPKYLLGISEDITERVTVEEALNRATKKLSLLNGITFDDIQNAVFSLSGYLELEKKIPVDGRFSQYLEKQVAIMQTIRDLLLFAKNYQDLGQRPPAWQNVLHTFLFAASHVNILNFSRHLRVEGLAVYADPLLEKVFLNMIENVLEHGRSATEISLYYRETDQGLTLFFEDNGEGIPVHMKEKIFERRFEGKKGLGLFLAREILSITNIVFLETGEYGKGARFEMRIPKGSYRFEKG